MSVVSFGLFGDQDVFRSEATGAAQIVASRFGGDPVVVKYNNKKGGGATARALLQEGFGVLDAALDFFAMFQLRRRQNRPLIRHGLARWRLAN